VLAALAALHVVQRRHYGRWGALASIVAFARVAMVIAAAVDMVLLILGVLAASVGIVGLGIVTISAGVLPRWCGVALIAGSLPGVGIVFTFLTPLAMARILPGEVGWALAGIPWAVVGFAVFRSTGRRTEQPSTVR
jgi:hypothetical protein